MNSSFPSGPSPPFLNNGVSWRTMRTAVATFGFGRPDHFERMLTSLGTCPEVVDGVVDVVHFLDGGPGAEQDALRAVIQRSGVPFTDIVARPTNLGVGRQLIGARRELLDERGYDRMVLVEDDIELNSTYLTTLLRLADWAEQYADVGTVQVWNVEAGTQDELEPRLEEVELTNRHFVTYCISKRAWDLIKPTLYAYEANHLLSKLTRNDLIIAFVGSCASASNTVEKSPMAPALIRPLKRCTTLSRAFRGGRRPPVRTPSLPSLCTLQGCTA